MSDESTSSLDSQPKWRPLPARLRRILGVLVEKAKTVPDSYPMTLNALKTGCNQKSNRYPQMNLDADDLIEGLEQLREMGAVGEVQGDGRVAKYRHYMYEWLAVDKHEIAVVTELLLRGEQTVGDLRARAARMESIADQAALRPILQSLMEKKLVVALTPEGRGQMVTHGLFSEGEMQKLRDRAAAAPPSIESAEFQSRQPTPRRTVADDVISELKAELGELREQLDELRNDVRDVKERLQG